MNRRSTRRNLCALAAALALVLVGCSDDGSASGTTRPGDDPRSGRAPAAGGDGPATTGVDVGDGTTPEDEAAVLAELPDASSARITTADGTVDLVVDRCAAARRDTLHLSGVAPDGSTLQVQITGTTSDVSWATSGGSWGGTVAGLSVEPSTRQFQLTGRLRPLDGSAAVSTADSYTVVGRCPS